MKKIVSSFLIGLTVGAGVAACAFVYLPKPQPKIEIKEVEKPVVKYVKVIEPTDTAALYDCYKSPITIDRELTGDIYRITASDGCKQTTISDKINIGTAGNWKLYVGVGAIGAAAGGYTMYKIAQLL